MDNFIIIKPTKEISVDELDSLYEALKNAFSNISISNVESIIIAHNIDDKEINVEGLFSTINAELYLDLLVFYGKRKFSEEYFLWVKEMFSHIYFNYDYFFFDEHSLLRLNIKNPSFTTKKIVLGEMCDDKDLLHTIRVFLECNMNTSKAADVLYMHRNTLINKLDKFIEVTGYDVRSFKDAIIIYSMI